MRDGTRLPHAVDLKAYRLMILVQVPQLRAPVIAPLGISLAAGVAALVPLIAAKAWAFQALHILSITVLSLSMSMGWTSLAA